MAVRRRPVSQTTKGTLTTIEQFTKAPRLRIGQGTRPQTLYGLSDSPTALASWLLDHPDGYGQPAAALTSAVLGDDQRILCGRTDTRRCSRRYHAYWVTNTGVSGSLLLGISFQLLRRRRRFRPGAVSAFPARIIRPRAAGRSGRIRTLSTTTSPKRVGTLQRGNSRKYSPQRSAKVCDPCARN